MVRELVVAALVVGDSERTNAAHCGVSGAARERGAGAEFGDFAGSGDNEVAPRAVVFIVVGGAGAADVAVATDVAAEDLCRGLFGDATTGRLGNKPVVFVSAVGFVVGDGESNAKSVTGRHTGNGDGAGGIS